MKTLLFVFIVLVILMAVSIGFAYLIYLGYRMNLKKESKNSNKKYDAWNPNVVRTRGNNWEDVL